MTFPLGMGLEFTVSLLAKSFTAFSEFQTSSTEIHPVLTRYVFHPFFWSFVFLQHKLYDWTARLLRLIQYCLYFVVNLHEGLLPPVVQPNGLVKEKNQIATRSYQLASLSSRQIFVKICNIKYKLSIVQSQKLLQHMAYC